MNIALRCAGVLAMLVGITFLHASPVPKDPRTPAKIELDRHEGTWRVTSYLIAGAEALPEGAEWLITFKNGAFTWSHDSNSTGKIAVIDPSKSPKQLDYTIKNGQDQSQVLKAVYKLDGDTFTDCFGEPGDDRPKELKSTVENGLLLLTYKRVKKID